MPFLGIPPSRLDLRYAKGNVEVGCVRSSAGVSTSIIVREGGSSALLDCGDGLLIDLVDIARAAAPEGLGDDVRTAMTGFMEGIDVILLSHHHFDHIGGLLSLLCFLDMLRRRSTLTILYPKGSDQVPRQIESFRSSLGRSPSFRIQEHAVSKDGSMSVNGWDIEWTAAHHCEVDTEGRVGREIPAMSYRIERSGASVFYSGDTGYEDRLRLFAAGSDLGIAEGTYPSGMPGNEAHMSVDEAKRMLSSCADLWIVHRTGASHASFSRSA
ncbi:MAG: MBL fold metallo-hydrolase [Candidatus Thermoplasmatota archaeon]|nr:MBL fold metallo-hydrolase [Candidatus Thermoplasmatota archaeon]